MIYKIGTALYYASSVPIYGITMTSDERIIGRASEIAQLEKAFGSKRAEFITVYGRRRIGKTYLIRRFFSQKNCLYFQVTGIYKGSTKVQLKEFVNQSKTTFLPSYASIDIPKNWMDTFKILTDILGQQDKKKRIVLFIDELPWMAGKTKKLLQALEYYWNRHWVDMPNVKLIACGSASSWIIKNIIKNKGGLHNRTTLRLPMEPFNLHETKAFLKYENINYDDYQTLQVYMCMGGIPYYLTMLEKRISAQQNINKICFQKKGGLLDEFSLLFSSLFENEKLYETLVKLIATKRYGISREEIENKLNYKGGSLTRRLTDLEQIGFIASFSPPGRIKKGLSYKIIDEYILFYLSWIAPSLKESLPAEKTNQYWESISETQAWKSWAGYAFEAVCFKHLNQIRRALHIPDGAAAYTWKHISNTEKSALPGAQIDLVFDRNDQIINICEIKYAKNAYVIDKEEMDNLLNKTQVYRAVTKTNKLIFVSLITTFGIQESKKSSGLISSAAILPDLFRENS